MSCNNVVDEAGMRLAGEILKKRREAYQVQVRNARRRSIEFMFSYEEWLDFWEGDLEQRGVNGLVMARKGDVGPYSVENCYIITAQQNIAERDKDKHSEALRASWVGRECWLSNTTTHPCNKRVRSPEGQEFNSAAEAARELGLTGQAIGARCRSSRSEWAYIG